MKSNTQFYTIAILSKIILGVTILLGTDSYEISKGEYNFLTLFGTLVFMIAIFLEFTKKNYVLSFIALAGMIIFQPIFPVFKDGIDEGDVDINKNLLRFSFLVLFAWVIYDIIMLIKAIRKNKNSNRNTTPIPTQDTNPATNLNIEILELTDDQYGAMKLMYGNEITREEALKKVNSIRAFKSVK